MKILYFLKTLFYFLIIELVFQFFVMKNEKLFLKRITKHTWIMLHPNKILNFLAKKISPSIEFLTCLKPFNFMCKLSFGTIHWNKKYKINFHTFWSYISYESSWPPFSFLQNWSSNTCPKKKKEKEEACHLQ